VDDITHVSVCSNLHVFGVVEFSGSSVWHGKTNGSFRFISFLVQAKDFPDATQTWLGSVSRIEEWGVGGGV